MPWWYNVTNNSSQPSANNYSWYGLNTYNQSASLLTVSPNENFCVTHATVYASAKSSAVLTRLALWITGGTVIKQSETFIMGVGSESTGGQAWQTVLIPTTIAYGSGTSFWVGLYRNPSGAHIVGTNTAIDEYRKTNTAGFPSISGMDGYATDTDEGLLAGVFYILAPSVVTNASATRNSDTSITVNWTNNSSTDRPYTGIQVHRWDNVNNTWYLLTTLSGSATSYTDTTTIANRKYQYALMPYNEVGASSSYVYTDYVNTTPSAPTNVIAISSGTSVSLTWTDNSTNENGFKIQSSTYSGGVWGAWTDEINVSSNTTSWTDTTPPNIVKYHVRAFTIVDGVLSSAYAVSNQLSILQAPSAPTNLSPDNIYFDANYEYGYVFDWLHNPLDGSNQTKYSVRYRLSGGSYPGTPQYNEIVSSFNWITFPPSEFTNGNTYKWQVKTWGAYSTGSDWSAEKTFYTVAKPTGTITSPTSSSDYTLSTLTMNWSFTGTLQVEFLAKLYDSNDMLLETKSGSSSAVTVDFDYNLSNGVTYTATLQVKDSTGLWSTEVETEFDVVFARPPVPTFILAKDETNGSVQIEITNPSPEGDEIEAISNNVYRSIDGGLSYTRILTDVPINTTVTDYLPILGTDTYYYVESVSATPTVETSLAQIIEVTCYGYYFLNSGDNYSNYLLLYKSVDMSEASGRKTVLQQFEGRQYQLKYQGTELKQDLNFSCEIDASEINAVRTLVNDIGNFFFRDYTGKWFNCAVLNPQFAKQDKGRIYKFSCNIIRIEGDE